MPEMVRAYHLSCINHSVLGMRDQFEHNMMSSMYKSQEIL